jgi:proline-specific peptidase
MIPVSDIASFSSHRPVIFYDQVGNGRPTHLQQKDTSFWNINLFIDELINLLAYFKISDDFDLLGHLWGRILASEFIICRQPSGLKRLVLVDSLASTRLRDISVAQLRKQLPEDTQIVLKECEAAGDTSSEKYTAALSIYYKRHMCRLDPMPEPLLYSLGETQKDPTVFAAM